MVDRTDKLYNPSSLSRKEKQFKNYFDQLMSEFGSCYQIYVRNEDFGRIIAAGVVEPINVDEPKAVSIYFYCRGVSIPNPLTKEEIDLVRNHLESETKGDLRIEISEKNRETL